MKIKVYCIGHLKESYWVAAQAEYLKRISKFCDMEAIELPDIAYKEGTGPSAETKVKEEECAKLLVKLNPNDFICAMDLNQKEPDSIGFSKELQDMFVKGRSTVNFVIGGSLGLSDEMKARANRSISFGKITLPHQLCRIMLLEQIFRAFKIANNEPYHK